MNNRIIKFRAPTVHLLFDFAVPGTVNAVEGNPTGVTSLLHPGRMDVSVSVNDSISNTCSPYYYTPEFHSLEGVGDKEGVKWDFCG